MRLFVPGQVRRGCILFAALCARELWPIRLSSLLVRHRGAICIHTATLRPAIRHEECFVRVGYRLAAAAGAVEEGKHRDL